MRSLMLLAAACLAAVPARAQVVHGRVVAVDGGSAVAGARVRLVPERGADSVSAQADSLGGFTLRAPGKGDYRLAASRLGFREAVSPEFGLEEGDSLEVLFRLSADTVLLNPLQVVAASHRRPRRLEEFYERAGRGAFGWFVTREEIERHPGSRTTDLLWMATGLRVTSGRGFGGVVRGRGGCVPAVYLDGMRIGAGSIDVWTVPGDLEGIEVYTGGGVPVQYAGPGSGCAVVLLWTRS
ncbi:MAG TPA: carboxypeptidase regulatory-like domain-containing protein [Longimicrobium sp.]